MTGWLYTKVLRARIWDCDYAIQRINTRLKDLREELEHRQAEQDKLETELFNHEHSLTENA